MTSIDDLLAAIRGSDPEAHEAALALGLLLEHRSAEDDHALAAAVGPELATRRLSPTERDAAVDGLIAYLSDTNGPHTMAVWALTKSYEPRAVPTLIAMLERTLTEPEDAPLAYQALNGVLTTGVMTHEHRDRSIAAVQRAAASRHGEVADTAQQFLEFWRRRGGG